MSSNTSSSPYTAGTRVEILVEGKGQTPMTFMSGGWDELIRFKKLRDKGVFNNWTHVQTTNIYEPGSGGWVHVQLWSTDDTNSLAAEHADNN